MRRCAWAVLVSAACSPAQVLTTAVEQVGARDAEIVVWRDATFCAGTACGHSRMFDHQDQAVFGVIPLRRSEAVAGGAEIDTEAYGVGMGDARVAVRFDEEDLVPRLVAPTRVVPRGARDAYVDVFPGTYLLPADGPNDVRWVTDGLTGVVPRRGLDVGVSVVPVEPAWLDGDTIALHEGATLYAAPGGAVVARAHCPSFPADTMSFHVGTAQCRLHAVEAVVLRREAGWALLHVRARHVEIVAWMEEGFLGHASAQPVPVRDAVVDVGPMYASSPMPMSSRVDAVGLVWAPVGTTLYDAPHGEAVGVVEDWGAFQPNAERTPDGWTKVSWTVLSGELDLWMAPAGLHEVDLGAAGAAMRGFDAAPEGAWVVIDDDGVLEQCSQSRWTRDGPMSGRFTSEMGVETALVWRVDVRRPSGWTGALPATAEVGPPRPYLTVGEQIVRWVTLDGVPGGHASWHRWVPGQRCPDGVRPAVFDEHEAALRRGRPVAPPPPPLDISTVRLDLLEVRTCFGESTVTFALEEDGHLDFAMQIGGQRTANGWVGIATEPHQENKLVVSWSQVAATLGATFPDGSTRRWDNPLPRPDGAEFTGKVFPAQRFPLEPAPLPSAAWIDATLTVDLDVLPRSSHDMDEVRTRRWVDAERLERVDIGEGCVRWLVP